MKRSNYCSCLAILVIAALSFQKLQGQTVYETISSGSWGDTTIWRRWVSGQVGVGTSGPIVAPPTGTHKVIIHTGHIVEMGGANRTCRGLTVETGGKLWANEATPRRLQPCNGGTGHPYPVNDTVRIDGALGGAGDGIFIEPGVQAGTVTITGSGTIDILRIRMSGGLSGSESNGGAVNMIFDADINLYQHDNYVLSAVYNPAPTDNYSMTINPGKTIKLIDTSGYWHYNAAANTFYGNYTYNILGTLDLSMNNQAYGGNRLAATVFAPPGVNSHITVNIDGGILKTGRVFIADTSVYRYPALGSTGILKLRMVNGGQFDASAAQNCVIGYTSDGAGGYYPLIWASSRGVIRQTVPDSSVIFPVSTDHATPGNNRVELRNSGVEDVFAVAVGDVFDHAPDAPSLVINRQWDIEESVLGGSNVSMRLAWVTADEGAGVSHAAGSYFNIMHWNGNAWEYFPATVTGAGTVNDPYVAETSGITSFSPFGVINNFPVPVPVSFTDVKAWLHNGSIQVAFVNGTELNIQNYEVQRSLDGSNFSKVAIIPALKNNGSISSYQCTDAGFSIGNIFYRIKAADKNGAVVYSNIVKVSPANGSQDVVVYPVPVTGNAVSISLQNISAGQYTLNITNKLGQIIHTEKIDHPGGSSGQVLQLPAAMQKGIYTLQLTNGSIRINKNLVIQ